MEIVILFVALGVMLVLGAPVAVALAGSALLYILTSSPVPPLIVAHRMINGVDSFPLLAVPFFILAGNLMNTAGITERIFKFALAVVGWLRGGLGHVNVGASVIFAGMSGAAVADAGGLGAIEIKAMRDAGYDDEFSVGITAASSTIGPIIPPSLPMVIYGVVAGVSIGQLFAAGFIPGLIMAVSLMMLVAFIAWRRNYPRDQAFQLSVLWYSFHKAFLSLLTPVIIVGGILTGAFTPTEAAVAACAYALFLGLFVYRTLTLRRFLRVSFDTIETTAVVLMVVGAAAIFAWVLTANRVPELMAGMLLSASDRPWVILLLINLILLIVGMFMETVAAITITVPVLLPVALELGIDPVHFGVILVLNLMIGLLTPPVGMVLYVLARVANIRFERAVVGTAPFIVPLAAVLMLITFVPAVTMWLPTLIYR
ncbi:TRAP transporter large permease [Roseinatronobacter alkalisoli]|uniref:TRAP transporter large permease protein n=1 Tax=Roseinatronobacter alkalisoli TaxID=3028235 RepID=A0ABT5TF71_9RHOB|nr:TRAP transporter large permease [Roseinatronobacter sp. HJB301]MDD7973763.1 TRAP transporter large permease [Roseinatronobacter sp. HJB301]